jgi:HlyD family secretion protein
MQGHVKHVDEVASQSDWLTSDVRVYRTLVSIDESLPDLKPGMSASVTIYTDTKADDVLAIPVQAVLGNNQNGFFCFTLTPEGPLEKPIKLGVSNEKMIEIKDGLNEGDVVVLNPKSLSRDSKKDSSKGEKNDAPTSPSSKKKDKKSKT